MPVGWLTPDWPAPAGVRALSTLRGGGVSTGRYASLNLGEPRRDVPAAVAENRRRLRVARRAAGGALLARQVHGVRVADLDARRNGEPRADADAAVTRAPGRVLRDPDGGLPAGAARRRGGGAVAAAHAGWRGLAAA